MFATLRWIALLACAVALTAVARGDEYDKRTVVTFSGPVEIPGKTLPAGAYVFKLLDSTANRNIVQIFDKDETRLYATILAIPDYIDTPPNNTVIRFEERAAGTPEAIKEWFYPGDTYGVQFVYPHDQAVRVAKRTNQNVLAMRNEMEGNIGAPVKSANDPKARAMQNAEVSGVNPSGSQIASEQVVSSKPRK